VCARNDWAKIDRIVVSNFVSASQAAEEVVFRRFLVGIIGLAVGFILFYSFLIGGLH
jgi:hypothetical protein